MRGHFHNYRAVSRLHFGVRFNYLNYGQYQVSLIPISSDLFAGFYLSSFYYSHLL